VAEIYAATDRVPTLLFFLGAAVALVVGGRAARAHYNTPDYGLGYALGIIGGSLMLALLIYPIRKRSRGMRWLGPVRHWFRVHMIFGVLGPLAILYHCNFSLGATNSNVALLCMVVVASSGLFGRYFYTRIHYGLYGAKVTLAELKEDADFTRGRLQTELAVSERLKARLLTFEQAALQPAQGLVHAAWRTLTIGIHTHLIHWLCIPQLQAAIAEEARREGWQRAERRRRQREARRYLAVYLDSVRKVAQKTLYERLFALWHVLHIPLFIMMVLSVIAHIVAVHVY
jgi:hypothetical protein